MTEKLEAVARLGDQLRRAGVPSPEASATLGDYLHALVNGGDAAWRTFYHAVHQRLSDLAARDYPYAGSGALPLLALLDDDLGSLLIPAAERKRIRRRLVEYDRREARVPS